MKRLLNKQAKEAEILYRFKSPIIVNFSDETSFKAETEPLTQCSEYEAAISEAVDSDMSEMGHRGLAQYLDEPLNSKIDRIVVEVVNKVAVTSVTAFEELSSQEIEDLKEYIEGQFSDGWGEGFEQNPVESFQSEYDEEVQDEETGEYYIEPVEYTVDVSASFWDSNSWSITQIQ